MTKTIVDLKTNKVSVEELSSEDIAQHEKDAIEIEAQLKAEADAKTEKENLKASAKQKLMNGEALTEDEANVMVGL